MKIAIWPFQFHFVEGLQQYFSLWGNLRGKHNFVDKGKEASTFKTAKPQFLSLQNYIHSEIPHRPTAPKALHFHPQEYHEKQAMLVMWMCAESLWRPKSYQPWETAANPISFLSQPSPDCRMGVQHQRRQKSAGRGDSLPLEGKWALILNLKTYCRSWPPPSKCFVLKYMQLKEKLGNKGSVRQLGFLSCSH